MHTHEMKIQELERENSQLREELRQAFARAKQQDLEVELRKTKALAEAISNTTKALIVGLDPQGNVVFFNKQCEKLTGWTQAEVLGKNWFSTFLPEHCRHQVETAFFALLGQPGGKLKENPILTKAGEQRLIAWDNSIIKDDFGKASIVLGTGLDITERNESDERFEVIFEASPSSFVMTDEKGKITLVNAQTEKLFGYSRQELIGQSVEVLIPERFRVSHASFLEAFISKPKETMSRNFYGLCKDGREVPLEVALARVKTHKGIIVLSVIVDISIRKNIEVCRMQYQQELESRVRERTRELSQANSFLDSLIENIPNMIFVKDAEDLSFVRINKTGEDLLGFMRQELVGKNDYDFFPKAEADFFTSKDRSVLSEGKFVDILEEPIQTKFKGKRFLHTKKIPLVDEHGKPRYLLGISEDITERKVAEENRLQLKQEQLARAEAEKGIRLRDDFIAVASHELKTPLTALSMQIQILPKLLREVDFSGKDHFCSLLENSLKQLEHFLDLVDNLLDVSRINAGRMILQKQRVSLSEIISRTLEQYKAELQAAGCAVEIDLDPTIQGRWDPIRIGQIIVNLLTNAMKYGARNPIEITARLEGNRAKLVVRDHGIGIEKADQKKIFERFERATPVTRYRGLGLGLYITRQIVRAHGGTIRVESEIGKGSTFVIDLPIQTENLKLAIGAPATARNT
jgi:PAS domain S-box-containing protein